MIINGCEWDIKFVDPDSQELYRSDGSKTVGVTDRNKMAVYLDNRLSGAFLTKVLTHEICHCACYSYGLDLDIETEEIIADYISLFGKEIIEIADSILGRIHERKVF